jgi:transcriptional regulator with XRE-family HTH domain
MSDTPAVLAELRRAWLASGLTQQEIAGRTGIVRPNITRALNGKHMPTLKTLACVAHALGYDLALIPREDAV